MDTATTAGTNSMHAAMREALTLAATEPEARGAARHHVIEVVRQAVQGRDRAEAAPQRQPVRAKPPRKPRREKVVSLPHVAQLEGRLKREAVKLAAWSPALPATEQWNRTKPAPRRGGRAEIWRRWTGQQSQRMAGIAAHVSENRPSVPPVTAARAPARIRAGLAYYSTVRAQEEADLQRLERP